MLALGGLGATGALHPMPPAHGQQATDQQATPAPAAAEPAGAAEAQSPSPPPPVDTAAAPPLGGSDSTPAASGTLPRDLSPWGMFMAADLVVKTVMIGLAFASLVTWTIWIAKSIELALARHRLRRAHDAVRAAPSLAEARKALQGTHGVAAGFVEEAAIELRASSDIADREGIKARIASRLADLALAAGRDMNRGTGLLATIGSTAPFVGLFGTVWGIMNSFIGISKAQTTNLAVVAPGIAEALLATAIGLVAAIPAVIIYNLFSRSIGAHRASLQAVSSEVQRLVSRDLDRGARPSAAPAAE